MWQVQKLHGLSIGGGLRLWLIFVLRGSFDQQNPVDENTGYVLAKRARQFGNVGTEYKSTQIGCWG